MKVLDYGSIELVDFMGGDQRVDQAAGVSLGRFDRARGDDAVRRIVGYMMKHRHGTPFEHSVFTFHIKAPIFVAREWMRHRIGSFNEISGRYTELPREHYVPVTLRMIDPDNKQGSIETDDGHEMLSMIRQQQEAAFVVYEQLLNQGVAREVARGVLPLSTFTEFVWTVNARSLMNFLSLRLTEDAQWEIRQYAWHLLRHLMDKMPLTYEAFTANDSIAP